MEFEPSLRLAGCDYLCGGFTYADVAMGRSAFIPLGPAVRTVWTNEAIAAEFRDLVAGRDRLYPVHQ